MQQGNRTRKQKGFSLVELVIVIAIVLIIAAIAIPNVMTTLESYRLDSAARTISGKLTDARISAIKQNRQTWLLFNVGAGTYQVQTTDAGGLPVNVGNPERLPAGVLFDSPPTPAQISYDALGRMANLPNPPLFTVRLRVLRSGQRKTLTVSSTGRVALQ